MKKSIAIVLTSIALTFAGPPMFAADIVETATTAGSFKTFIAALKTADLTQALKTSGPYTVFAPSDEAFAKLPPGTWNALRKDKTKLAQILAYHVVPGRIMVADVKPGKVKTIRGNSLMLRSDNGKITVDDANVTLSDLSADNGVIHVIDAVVLPK